jgi:hypothetical protein
MTVLAAVAAGLAAAIGYALGRAATTAPDPAPDTDTTTKAPAPGVPRVTVQTTDDHSPCRTVQAVAEISDGPLTARATATKTTDPGGIHLGHPHAPISTCGAAHVATDTAISTARALLRGAQAGYAAEPALAAEQATAQADTACPAPAPPACPAPAPPACPAPAPPAFPSPALFT